MCKQGGKKAWKGLKKLLWVLSEPHGCIDMLYYSHYTALNEAH